MTLFDQPANEFGFELQRLSEAVYWRFTQQCDTLAAQRMHDRFGILDLYCRSC